MQHRLQLQQQVMQSGRHAIIAAIGLRATGQGLNERERQGRSSVAAAGVMQSDRRDTVAAIRLRATGLRRQDYLGCGMLALALGLALGLRGTSFDVLRSQAHPASSRRGLLNATTADLTAECPLHIRFMRPPSHVSIARRCRVSPGSGCDDAQIFVSTLHTRIGPGTRPVST